MLGDQTVYARLHEWIRSPGILYFLFPGFSQEYFRPLERQLPLNEENKIKKWTTTNKQKKEMQMAYWEGKMGSLDKTFDQRWISHFSPKLEFVINKYKWTLERFYQNWGRVSRIKHFSHAADIVLARVNRGPAFFPKQRISSKYKYLHDSQWHHKYRLFWQPLVEVGCRYMFPNRKWAWNPKTRFYQEHIRVLCLLELRTKGYGFASSSGRLGSKLWKLSHFYEFFLVSRPL